MKLQLLLSASTVLCASLIMSLSAHGAEGAPSLDALQGKWSASRTNREGRISAQTLEIKKDKLTFEMRNADNEVRFVAMGTVKVEKVGPFTALHLAQIQAGRSKDDLQAIDEERSVIYRVYEERLYIATSFDRDNERPMFDAYERVETPKASASASPAGEDKLIGTWKLEITMGENTRDYELRIAKADGKLGGTLVSSRSGDHPCKSVQFKDGELVVEIEREYSGSPATFIYKAKFEGEQLTGTVTVKGLEDQFSGKVKATR